MVSEIIAKLIRETDDNYKLSLVDSLIPKHIKYGLSKIDNEKFQIKIQEWVGKCYYIPTLEDPDKFVKWVIHKNKNLTNNVLRNKLESVIANNTDELTISRLFNQKHSDFVEAVRNLEVPSNNKALIDRILLKPDIKLWNTGVAEKLNKVGIPKL